MEFSVDINPADRNAVLEWNGTFSAASYERACAAITRHPDWRTDFNLLVVIGPGMDLDEMTIATLEEMRTFSRTWNALSRTGPDPRTAIVSTSDLKRVIADLWMALVAKNWSVSLSIFTSIDEARAWLACSGEESGIRGGAHEGHQPR